MLELMLKYGFLEFNEDSPKFWMNCNNGHVVYSLIDRSFKFIPIKKEVPFGVVLSRTVNPNISNAIIDSFITQTNKNDYKTTIKRLQLINSTCNFNCSYCIGKVHSTTKPDKYPDVESVLNTLKKHPTIDTVQFIGGEPFTDYDKVLAIITSLEDKYSVLISTNGSLLNSKRFEELTSVCSDLIIRTTLSDGDNHLTPRQYAEIVSTLKNRERATFSNCYLISPEAEKYKTNILNDVLMVLQPFYSQKFYIDFLPFRTVFTNEAVRYLDMLKELSTVNLDKIPDNLSVPDSVLIFGNRSKLVSACNCDTLVMSDQSYYGCLDLYYEGKEKYHNQPEDKALSLLGEMLNQMCSDCDFTKGTPECRNSIEQGNCLRVQTHCFTCPMVLDCEINCPHSKKRDSKGFVSNESFATVCYATLLMRTFNFWLTVGKINFE